MSWYRDKVLPHVIEHAASIDPLMKQRGRVVPLASGRVLEVGFGTGLNMAYYDRAKVEKIFALDPFMHLPGLTAERVARSGLDVELVRAVAEDIPFDDETFDTVLMTFTLCSLPDPHTALREIRRVLKTGGRLIFSEHGLAPEPAVRRWQRALNPCWQCISGGCHLDRDVPALLKGASFGLEGLHMGHIPTIRIVSWNYWGEARKTE
jgi:SAM-dependent methyltransferase